MYVFVCVCVRVGGWPGGWVGLNGWPGSEHLRDEKFGAATKLSTHPDPREAESIGRCVDEDRIGRGAAVNQSPRTAFEEVDVPAESMRLVPEVRALVGGGKQVGRGLAQA